MPYEIERKFLVHRTKWEKVRPKEGLEIRQGYLSKEIDKTVRVRTKGNKGFLTVKGKTEGISRQEFEYEIPHSDALQLLKDFISTAIHKTRYEVVYELHTWEVDVFYGANEGLILAEVELESENDPILLPEWIAEEVSDDPRYYNAALIDYPFSEWE